MLVAFTSCRASRAEHRGLERHRACQDLPKAGASDYRDYSMTTGPFFSTGTQGACPGKAEARCRTARADQPGPAGAAAQLAPSSSLS